MFFSRKKSVVASGLLAHIEDRHSHILYGVDDGVGTVTESLDLMDWFSDLGLTELWLTPHVMEDIPNTTEGLKKRFSELCSVYEGPLRLHIAAEYMIDNLFLQRLEEKDLLCMEDNMVLMETSTVSSPFNLDEILDRTMRSGYRPLLAHPERYVYMQSKDYQSLVAKGVRLQLNLPSLAGVYGRTERDKAKEMLSKGMYSYVGSDCHNFRWAQKLYEEEWLDKSEIKAIISLKRI